MHYMNGHYWKSTLCGARSNDSTFDQHRVTCPDCLRKLGISTSNTHQKPASDDIPWRGQEIDRTIEDSNDNFMSHHSHHSDSATDHGGGGDFGGGGSTDSWGSSDSDSYDSGSSCDSSSSSD
jgi:hypothetical protein